jgi:hypothetical protein
MRFEVGDRCSYGDHRATIRAINLDRTIAAIEFDSEPYVTYDVSLESLESEHMAPQEVT